MSSDNGYQVLPVDDRPEEWGIFYYQGDNNEPACPARNARMIESNPIAAILKAHRIDKRDRTEYGVYVGEECLRAAELTMAEYLSGREW
jgi:hypothetical protein